jgi:hypothetical protein
LREDLESGVLDLLMFVTTDPKILDKVRELATGDPIVREELARVRFFLFEESNEL